jgi:hypothetical protein
LFTRIEASLLPKIFYTFTNILASVYLIPDISSHDLVYTQVGKAAKAVVELMSKWPKSIFTVEMVLFLNLLSLGARRKPQGKAMSVFYIS